MEPLGTPSHCTLPPHLLPPSAGIPRRFPECRGWGRGLPSNNAALHGGHADLLSFSRSSVPLLTDSKARVRGAEPSKVARLAEVTHRPDGARTTGLVSLSIWPGTHPCHWPQGSARTLLGSGTWADMVVLGSAQPPVPTAVTAPCRLQPGLHVRLPCAPHGRANLALRDTCR